MKREQLNISVILTFISFLTLSSCGKDDHSETERRDADKTWVTFTIQAPAASTRAMSEKNEKAVGEIDILVFNTAANGGEYVYTAHCDGSEIEYGGDRSSFTVELKTGIYDLVIIANSTSIVEGVSLAGKTKNDLSALLIKDINSYTDKKWPTDGSALFPMWGEATNMVISDAVTHPEAIQLLRMVAKVDASVSAADFKITSFHLYNYNDKGAIVPDAASIVVEDGKKKVNSHTIPASTVTTRGPIDYTAASGGVTSFMNEIYFLEARNIKDDGEEKEKSARTCLVVGGIWDEDGDGTFDERISYYRVDFVEKESQKILDILRNRRYILDITSVSGHGEDDKDKAFESEPVNITVEILAWDDTDMNETVWNGQNELTVNKGLFEFHEDGITQILKVYTDYPDGWEITYYPDWITVGTDIGPAGVNTEVELTADPYTHQTIREDYIVVTAGNLTKKIKVTQDNDVDFVITIDPAYLTFYANGGSKEVKITASSPWMATHFELVPGYLDLQNPTAGSGENTILITVGPHPFPDAGPLTASIIVTLDRDGRVERQALINIVQQDYNLLFDFSPWEKYLNNGRYYYPATGSADESLYFYGQTARSWEYAGAESNGAAFDGFTPLFSGVQQPSEDSPKEYFFELESNSGWTERPVTVTVTSPDDNIEDHSFILWQDYTKPFIEITKPLSKIVDFGLDNTGITIEMEIVTNARYEGVFDGVDYVHVIGSYEGIPGGSSANSLARNTHTLKFTNKVLDPEVDNVREAGYVLENTVLFLNTADHSPASMIFAPGITIKRTVPEFFKQGSVTYNDVTGAGGTIKVSAYSNALWGVTATFSDGSPEITDSQPAAGYGQREVTLSIPANPSWSSRTVTLTYVGAGSGTVATITQPGYDEPSLSYSTVGRIYNTHRWNKEQETLNYGFDLHVSVDGYLPDLQVRINSYKEYSTDDWYPSNPKEWFVTDQKTLPGGTGRREIVFDIPNNDHYSNISHRIEYLNPRTNTWEYSLEGSKDDSHMHQGTGSFRLKSTGRYLSHYHMLGSEIFPTYWNRAMSIDSQYNYTYFYSTYGNDKSNWNHIPPANDIYGCGAYWEIINGVSYPRGTWKLITLPEILDIIEVQRSYGNHQLNTNGAYPYWPSEELSPTTVITKIWKGGSIVEEETSKDRHYGLVRCVRDPD